MRDNTRCVHRPEISTDGFASLTVATYRASTIRFTDAQAYAKRSERGPDGYSYGLHGTPTSRTLEAQITSLEQGVRTALLPSGQAAIAAVMNAVLLPGDRVLIPDNVYPPVRGFCENYLKPRGIGYGVYDPMIGEGIAGLIDATTRLVWVESPGSTTMEIQDIPAIVNAAHAKGALVGCDNTWATPLLFKPLAHGVDFSVEAITKYMGGHADLLMGSISVRELPLHRRVKDVMRMQGIGVSPDDCSLVLRGMETLGVRLAHCGRVALDIARAIEQSPVSDGVLHPALPSCPGHRHWQRDFAGASGVFSVVLKPEVESQLEDALGALKYFAIGASWGSTRSLIAPMKIGKDRTVSPWAREGTILRLSIGMEDPEDLKSDVEALFSILSARLGSGRNGKSAEVGKRIAARNS